VSIPTKKLAKEGWGEKKERPNHWLAKNGLGGHNKKRGKGGEDAKKRGKKRSPKLLT